MKTVVSVVELLADLVLCSSYSSLKSDLLDVVFTVKIRYLDRLGYCLKVILFAE